MKAWLTLCLSLTVISSCASKQLRDAPCYDGWTSDTSGRSSLWSPEDNDTFTAIASLISTQETLECIHRLPSGRLVVLTTSENFVHTTELIPSGSGYSIGERGYVVGHD